MCPNFVGLSSFGFFRPPLNGWKGPRPKPVEFREGPSRPVAPLREVDSIRARRSQSLGNFLSFKEGLLL